jgi:hydrophobe/amphiphile efflux-3 (HAE3) family protein
MRGLPEALSLRAWLKLILHHPKTILGAISLITLFLAFKLPALRFQSSIYDLAIEDLPEAAQYQAFKESFGSEEILLVVIRGIRVFEPSAFQRIGRLADELSKIKGVRRVISLPTIKRDMDLTGKWNLSEFEKIVAPVALFQKNLISSDGRATVITLVLADLKDKGPVVDAVQTVIDREKHGLKIYQIGMPVVSKAMANDAQRDFLRLPPIALGVMILILILVFRRPQSVVLPLVSVVVCLGWTLGFMGWAGIPLSMLTMIVPIFLTAVGTAYCMYILSEYGSVVSRSDSPAEAAFQCFVRVGFPTGLAIFTTMVGLGSLLVNRIEGIQQFAVSTCFGMASLFVILLTLLPVLLRLFPQDLHKGVGSASKMDFFRPLIEGIATVAVKHQKGAIAAILTVTVLGALGALRITVETNPVEYFKKSTAVSRQFHDVYKDMAGSFPLNVVLDSGEYGYFENPVHVAEMAGLYDFFLSLHGVDKVISFVDYVKLINYVTNHYEPKYYSLPKEPFELRMVVNSYKGLLGQDVFEGFMNNDMSKANILLRTHISSSSGFLAARDAIVRHLAQRLPKPLTAHVTGFGIVISESSQLLTEGQVKSLSLTLIVICATMFLLFLSWKVGLIALLPNCFPIVVSFGLMGWMGWKLSVATGLIASIAIGLAVDDTIHYLVRYNNELKKEPDRRRAMRATLQGVGRPIMTTTLTIGLGFSVLIFSNFQPTSVFGILMVVTMASALVGDLILLPSLMLRVELVTAWDLLKRMTTLDRTWDSIAHEMNQPLNAIKMGTEFLKMKIDMGEEIEPSELEAVTKEMGEQTDRAAEIVSRLRAFGREADLDAEKINISEPIREAAAMVAHEMRLHNIDLKMDLDQNVPLILAHHSRLRQLFFNILTNGWEAIDQKEASVSPPGQGVISVRSFRQRDKAVVVVADNGVGIPKQDRERVFEPFFTTKTTGRGRGLGLSIAYGIVRDYGGRISIRSKEGEGATVQVVLPGAPF